MSLLSGSMAVHVHTSESDRVIWLSVAYATFVSIAGEVAFGLERDDWIDSLDQAIDNADPVIAVAWPPELHPRGRR